MPWTTDDPIMPSRPTIEVSAVAYRDYDRPAYRAYGYDRGYRGCRTVTIERDDGSVRRVRRCD
jgi:hypothetical protein